MTNTKPAAWQPLINKIAAQSTDNLIAGMLAISEDTTDRAERLTLSLISDELENRLGLTDALDAIYEDINYAGTYTEAMLTAIAQTEAAA